MTDWNGTGDQYVVESPCYPDFSDMSDSAFMGAGPTYSLARRQPVLPSHHQPQVSGPVYNKHTSRPCDHGHPPPAGGCPCGRSPASGGCPCGRGCSCDHTARTTNTTHTTPTVGVVSLPGGGTIQFGAPSMILLVFVLLVLIFCIITRTITDLRSQVKLLKKLLKKE
jgi:hypothetical protein